MFSPHPDAITRLEQSGQVSCPATCTLCGARVRMVRFAGTNLWTCPFCGDVPKKGRYTLSGDFSGNFNMLILESPPHACRECREETFREGGRHWCSCDLDFIAPTVEEIDTYFADKPGNERQMKLFSNRVPRRRRRLHDPN